MDSMSSGGDMNMWKISKCVLSIVILVLLIVILVKVNKKCKGNSSSSENYSAYTACGGTDCGTDCKAICQKLYPTRGSFDVAINMVHSNPITQVSWEEAVGEAAKGMPNGPLNHVCMSMCKGYTPMNSFA